ncbi:MAG: hypothetical protein R2713_24140 [Ilumatobacteraceae bacterium]
MRVLDTCDAPGARLAAGGQVVIDLSTHVPAGTTAVAVNLTSVAPSTGGFLTGHPCRSTLPTVSSANFAAGTDRGPSRCCPSMHRAGSACSRPRRRIWWSTSRVRSSRRVAPRAARPGPPRRHRTSGRPDLLRLDVPLDTQPDATGVVLNLTATGSRRAGFVTAFPCGGAVPTVSNLNFGSGETVAGAAYVPLGEGGDVCLFSNVSADVDLVADLTGVFAPSGRLAFQPAEPTRVLDTRDGTGGWTPVVGAGQVIDVRVAPSTAAAVTGTLTMVAPARDGFLTVDECGAPPPTSNVNAPRAGVLANAVTTGLAADGRLCVRASSATQVVFDTTGWWIP